MYVQPAYPGPPGPHHPVAPVAQTQHLPSQQIPYNIISNVSQSSSRARAGAIASVTPQAARKKKLDEKYIPVEVATLVPEIKVLAELSQVEKKLDEAIARRKMDLVHAKRAEPQKVARRFTVEVTSRIEPTSKSIKLAIQGYASNSDMSKCQRKFTSFFRKIAITFDASRYPPTEKSSVEWNRTVGFGDSDGFGISHPIPADLYEIVKRIQDGEEAQINPNLPFSEIRAHFFLHLAHSPARFRLDPRLQTLLGICEDTRPRIFAALFTYLRANNLTIGSDRQVQLDDALNSIFFLPTPLPSSSSFSGSSDELKTIPYSQFLQKVSEYMYPAEPLAFDLKLPLSFSDSDRQTLLFDVEMDEVPVQSAAIAAAELAGSSTGLGKEAEDELAALDKSILETTAKLRESVKRRKFMNELADNPAEFIESLIFSQTRDLRVASQAVTEEARRTAVFTHHPGVQEAVQRYLMTLPQHTIQQQQQAQQQAAQQQFMQQQQQRR